MTSYRVVYQFIVGYERYYDGTNVYLSNPHYIWKVIDHFEVSISIVEYYIFTWPILNVTKRVNIDILELIAWDS